MFGEIFKSLRIKKGYTLREFCDENALDPGNISKLERGLLPAPQAEEKVRAYAKALGIKTKTQDYTRFLDLAVASHKNFTIKNIKNQDVLEKLPGLFRTLDKKEITEDKIDRIISLVKKELGE